MDNDTKEELVTAEEKALYDKRVGLIIGAIFSWEEDLQNPLKKIREMPDTTLHSSIECPTFDEEIPLKSYFKSDTSWLEVERFKVYCIIRCVEKKLEAGSTGFQLSKSFIGTTRNSSEKLGQFFVSRGDSTSLSNKYVASLIAKSPLLETKKIDFAFYDSLFPKQELIPGTNMFTDTKFDFSIMAPDPDGNIDLPQTEPYVVPSYQNVNSGDPIMVVGYPRIATDQYMQASYGDSPQPSTESFIQFFNVGKKVVSLGKVRGVSPHFMTVSAATCCGMSGSPVFSFSGHLLGFLIGSKNTLKYNIVIRVDHPTFVIEYMTYVGKELLHDNFELYFQHIEKFILKHFDLLRNASQNTKLSIEKRLRLQEVLSFIKRK